MEDSLNWQLLWKKEVDRSSVITILSVEGLEKSLKRQLRKQNTLHRNSDHCTNSQINLEQNERGCPTCIDPRPSVSIQNETHSSNSIFTSSSTSTIVDNQEIQLEREMNIPPTDKTSSSYCNGKRESNTSEESKPGEPISPNEFQVDAIDYLLMHTALKIKKALEEEEVKDILRQFEEVASKLSPDKYLSCSKNKSLALVIKKITGSHLLLEALSNAEKLSKALSAKAKVGRDHDEKRKDNLLATLSKQPKLSPPWHSTDTNRQMNVASQGNDRWVCTNKTGECACRRNGRTERGCVNCIEINVGGGRKALKMRVNEGKSSPETSIERDQAKRNLAKGGVVIAGISNDVYNRFESKFCEKAPITPIDVDMKKMYHLDKNIPDNNVCASKSGEGQRSNLEEEEEGGSVQIDQVINNEEDVVEQTVMPSKDKNSERKPSPSFTATLEQWLSISKGEENSCEKVRSTSGLESRSTSSVTMRNVAKKWKSSDRHLNETKFGSNNALTETTGDSQQAIQRKSSTKICGNELSSEKLGIEPSFDQLSQISVRQRWLHFTQNGDYSVESMCFIESNKSLEESHVNMRSNLQSDFELKPGIENQNTHVTFSTSLIGNSEENEEIKSKEQMQNNDVTLYFDKWPKEKLTFEQIKLERNLNVKDSSSSASGGLTDISEESRNESEISFATAHGSYGEPEVTLICVNNQYESRDRIKSTSSVDKDVTLTSNDENSLHSTTTIKERKSVVAESVQSHARKVPSADFAVQPHNSIPVNKKDATVGDSVNNNIDVLCVENQEGHNSHIPSLTWNDNELLYKKKMERTATSSVCAIEEKLLKSTNINKHSQSRESGEEIAASEDESALSSDSSHGKSTVIVTKSNELTKHMQESAAQDRVLKSQIAPGNEKIDTCVKTGNKVYELNLKENTGENIQEANNRTLMPSTNTADTTSGRHNTKIQKKWKENTQAIPRGDKDSSRQTNKVSGNVKRVGKKNKEHTEVKAIECVEVAKRTRNYLKKGQFNETEQQRNECESALKTSERKTIPSHERTLKVTTKRDESPTNVGLDGKVSEEIAVTNYEETSAITERRISTFSPRMSRPVRYTFRAKDATSDQRKDHDREDKPQSASNNARRTEDKKNLNLQVEVNRERQKDIDCSSIKTNNEKPKRKLRYIIRKRRSTHLRENTISKLSLSLSDTAKERNLCTQVNTNTEIVEKETFSSATFEVKEPEEKFSL